MTIEEAEAYYKKYLGHGFHMGREEPGSYAAFKKLNLPEEYFVRWDQDLLEAEFEKMPQNRENAWVHQHNVVDILFRKHCDRESWTKRLLDAMESIGQTQGSRTLMIEKMAGNTQSQQDGGVFLICTKTKQSARMKEVMQKLIADADRTNPRCKEAIRRYEAALRRYSRG